MTFAFVVCGVGFLVIYDHGFFILGYIARCIGIAMACIGAFMSPFGTILGPIGNTMVSIGNAMVPLGDAMMARFRTEVTVDMHVRNLLKSVWAWLGGPRGSSS